MQVIKNAIQSFLMKRGYRIVKILTPENVDENDINTYIDLYGEEAVKKRLFVNIGAGPSFYHPAWIALDKITDSYKHLPKEAYKDFDLLSFSPLPFEDNSIQIVYTSHTMEHISEEAAVHTFKESYRILKPDGIIRIVVPDADILYRAYLNKDKYLYAPWFQVAKTPSMIEMFHFREDMEKLLSFEQCFILTIATSVSVCFAEGNHERISDDKFKELINSLGYEKTLDYITKSCPVEIHKKYPVLHMSWWNADKLIKILKDIGFKKVYKSGYMQSVSPVLRNTKYFDYTHPEYSLYVEAIK